MAARRRPSGESHELAAFPPVPRLPKAPQLPPDPRQAGSTRIIGAIADTARVNMHVSGPNLSTGFHASAVDVGRLQSVIERGLARFNDAQLEARWDEIFDWLRRVARTWVQRCKHVRFERRQSGIRIELQTQDDLGYYEYGFDAFPGRGRNLK